MPGQIGETDEILAARVQEGDERAFAELMTRYTPKLLRYGRRFLSSQDAIGDVVQDVFVSSYENMRDFDATRQFSPWIYRIAHNAFVDAIRRKSRDPIPLDPIDLDRIMPHPLYEDPKESEKEKEEMRVVLEKGLGTLPRPYREIVDLYYFEDFGYQEIADILRIPIGTVGIRLMRAKKILRKTIESDL